MSLDEATEYDEKFEQQQVTFVVDRVLLQRCGRIKLDFVEDTHWTGFGIFPENQLTGGC